MARFFRFVEKKRGARRTGSNWIGSLGEAIFCACLFLLGSMLLSVIVGTQLWRPDPDRFALGVGGWLLVLVTASSVLLGGGGLIWTVLRIGTSVERRSALARQAAESDIAHSAAPRPRNFPTLPSVDGLVDSPGIELAYRLPSSQTPGWQLLATTIFTMLWNLVVCLLTVSIFTAHIAGQHEWLLTALLVPCWGVCYWSIRTFLNLLVMNSGMAQTTVEVSDLPLTPGREYQVVIAQHGHTTMRSLELWVVCEEEATYAQGTDIRTEIREVYRRSHLRRQDFQIEPGRPSRDIDEERGAHHKHQRDRNLADDEGAPHSHARRAGSRFPQRAQDRRTRELEDGRHSRRETGGEAGSDVEEDHAPVRRQVEANRGPGNANAGQPIGEPEGQ